MILANADSIKSGMHNVAAVFSGTDLIYMTQADTSILTYQINSSNTAYSITGTGSGILFGHLDLPSTYNGLPVTAIADGTNSTRVAFFNNDYIRKVTIPSSITTIGSRAFSFSDRITTIILHNNISSIGFNAFEGLSKLSSISLPSGLTELDTGLLSGCTSLTSITIPSRVTAIGASVFNRTSISSISIPSLVNSIGNSTFASCTSLTSITIPNSVTLIGRDLFNGCSALTSATFGSGITEIRERTFFNCTSLSTINCLATTAPTLEDTNAFGNVSATEFHVPTGATGYSATYGGLTVVKDL